MSWTTTARVLPIERKTLLPGQENPPGLGFLPLTGIVLTSLVGIMLGLMLRRRGYSLPKAQQQYGVPFAKGPRRPHWPLDSRHDPEVPYTDVDGEGYGRTSRRFSSSRDEGSRRHAGIDLFADAGDPVLTIEDGHVVSIQDFLGDTKAVLIQGASGLVSLYGEIRPSVRVGQDVMVGQRIGNVAVTPAGTSMLHFETYTEGTRRNAPWFRAREVPPPNLLDPTEVLLRAAEGSGRPIALAGRGFAPRPGVMQGPRGPARSRSRMSA